MGSGRDAGVLLIVYIDVVKGQPSVFVSFILQPTFLLLFPASTNNSCLFGKWENALVDALV